LNYFNFRLFLNCCILFVFASNSLYAYKKLDNGEIEFSIASYNVLNLFDDKYDGSEYKEFIPNIHYGSKDYHNKLKKITHIIKNIDADIIGLQECENINVLNDLAKNTNYKYKAVSKKARSSIAVGVLSRFEIVETKQIKVYSGFRDILRIKLKIKDSFLYVYINHWSSKRAKESARIYYAKALINDIRILKEQNPDIDYVILGDFNSDYNEFVAFKYNKKLNDTHGITGINQILNTAFNNNLVAKKDILDFDFANKNLLHYNLWLELGKDDRFSYIFRGYKTTPDNMIVPYALFDDKAISYKDGSFGVYKSKEVYNPYSNKIIRAYSDHLPIYAFFTTKKQNYKSTKANTINKNQAYMSFENTLDAIEFLYSNHYLSKKVVLKNMIVLYKSKHKAVFKSIKYANTQNTKHKSILFYAKYQNELNLLDKLQVGKVYDIEVSQIDDYFGTKSISKFAILQVHNNKKYNNLDNFYLKDAKDELFKPYNQNEIISNLKGIYKNRYLYYNNSHMKMKKVKLYFIKGIKKPSKNSQILIKNGQLGVFKNKIQIIINKPSDYEAL